MAAPEVTISLNGKQTPLSEAKKELGIPDEACFGCWLGDDGCDTHDRCYLGRAYAELEEM